jgi:hypothetical protein
MSDLLRILVAFTTNEMPLVLTEHVPSTPLNYMFHGLEYFGYHVKRMFPTTVIMDQRVSHVKPFIGLNMWK